MIGEATGDASGFDQLLVEYYKAPSVTLQRLYIDALEDVMTASTKIMIDVEGGNNMLYLPLDKIMEQNSSLGSSGNREDPQQLRDLANQLAPYLPNVGTGAGSADRGRLTNNSRGLR